MLTNVLVSQDTSAFITTTHTPIMLFKLPIMLLSNAPNIALLCPNYAPMFPVMLHKLMLYLSPTVIYISNYIHFKVVEHIELYN